MLKDPQVRHWAVRIGQKLRKRRKALGLSLEEVSLLSGAAVPTVSHIERGNRDARLSTLIALARAARIDLPELFAQESGNKDRRNSEDSIVEHDPNGK